MTNAATIEAATAPLIATSVNLDVDDDMHNATDVPVPARLAWRRMPKLHFGKLKTDLVNN